MANQKRDKKDRKDGTAQQKEKDGTESRERDDFRKHHQYVIPTSGRSTEWGLNHEALRTQEANLTRPPLSCILRLEYVDAPSHVCVQTGDLPFWNISPRGSNAACFGALGVNQYLWMVGSLGRGLCKDGHQGKKYGSSFETRGSVS